MALRLSEFRVNTCLRSTKAGSSTCGRSLRLRSNAYQMGGPSYSGGFGLFHNSCSSKQTRSPSTSQTPQKHLRYGLWNNRDTLCVVVFATAAGGSSSASTDEILDSGSLTQVVENGYNGLASSSSRDVQTSHLYPQDAVSSEVQAEVSGRLKRLQVLFLLKRLYRDVLRCESVLNMPVPELARSDDEIEPKVRKPKRRIKEWIGRGSSSEAQMTELIVDTSVEILDYADDIRELAESLKTEFEEINGQVSDVFRDDKEAELMIQTSVTRLEERLLALAAQVEASLSAEEKQEALQQREALNDTDEEGDVQTRVLRRLEKSLPDTGLVLASFKKRIATVDLSQVNLNFIQRSGYNVVNTLGDVWRRLNGQPSPSSAPALASLPSPSSVLVAEDERKLSLILQVEALDKRLREVSRQREQKLREKNVLARTRLASEIRTLDDQVNEVRKELAVRTLQVEMSLILLALEEELLDVTGSQDLRTDEEELLLVAEFGLLDADLARLRSCVDREEAILVEDEELAVLATDIPDLKQRLGILEEASIPLPQRLSLTLQDGSARLRQGFHFYWRGLRLLGGDVSYSLRLFWAAVRGTTLKPREAQALRRTAKDVLVLIPFAVILIAPITPVGHVVVFSFLQRSFPGFFPSSFTPKRQEVMKRNEVLKERLQLAASDLEREEALAMAALAEAETFETPGEDSSGSGVPGHPAEGGAVAASSAGGRAPRRFSDRPIDLSLLQEQLPEVAQILSQMKGFRKQAGKAEGVPPPLPLATAIEGGSD